MNWRGRGRERFWTSSFYSRVCELCANTQILNKSQIHFQTLTGFETYICVCVYTSSVDYFLIVLLWSIHFSNKNVSLFNSNKKLLNSDKSKFWTELRVLSGCTAMPDTVTTKLFTNSLHKRLHKQVCLQLLQQSCYTETTPNICGYE